MFFNLFKKQENPEDFYLHHFLTAFRLEREARVEDLKAVIDSHKSEIQRLNNTIQALMDRLLERHNINPLLETRKGIEKSSDEVAFTPWGAIPDVDGAFKQSWIDEEINWLHMTAGLDLEAAKRKAEENWLLKSSPAGS